MNVLGDCFGAGVVQHFSTKYLNATTTPSSATNLQTYLSSEPATVNDDTPYSKHQPSDHVGELPLPDTVDDGSSSVTDKKLASTGTPAELTE